MSCLTTPSPVAQELGPQSDDTILSAFHLFFFLLFPLYNHLFAQTSLVL